MGTIPAGVQPGDFFCTFSNSRTSKLVAIGEYLNGDRFARTRGRQFSHTGVAVSVHPAKEPGRDPLVMIAEAEPGGVRLVPWHYGGDTVVLWSTGRVTIPDRDAVTAKARSLVGTPYGFLNYPAIGAKRLGIPVPFLNSYIVSERSLICSEFTDISERAGGLVLCPGRIPGFTTPQEIADFLLSAGARAMHGRDVPL